GCDYYCADGSVKKAGTFGIAGTTSFFPSKNLGAYGDAGAIITNDDALAEKLRMVANHGQSKRYYHDLVGCNSRLDTMQAAILEVKLKYLDQYIKARMDVADYYDEAFKNHPKITIPYRAVYCNHVFHQYTILLDGVDRDGLIAYLAAHKIPSMIYYPVPAHKQKMFSLFDLSSINLPVTDKLSERVLSLPIHTEMSREQLELITTKVLEFTT
ncbi:MAG TPA: DegT/DnrJ/EryC1/StrS family aminotransferase, partial [Chitinophagaceae bacterium]|nr:DegT/DnrJ/EryC1/StrS family aminotransferase [Chitinophagaceae bacterium]